ncbi:MAG: phosphatase PAP2 family protein [Rubrobacter sp.]|nr:phosphatase PAP2 family protein [Rubrobacter sp.]
MDIVFPASATAFALVSAATGAGLFSVLDRWILGASQRISLDLLDRFSGFFSLAGSLEVIGAALVLLLLILVLTGRRRLAVRLLAAFVVTGLVELGMKFFLSVPPMPDVAARMADPTPLVAFEYPFPYPSGHTLRSILVFGAIFVLWKNGISRTVLAIFISSMALSRVYLGVHWTSDVVGGALLGIAGLAWVLRPGKE